MRASRLPLTVMALVLTVSACSAKAQAPETGAPVVHAQVDQKSGTIVLPLDRFSASSSELNDLQYAISLVLQDCMRGKGYTYQAVDQRGLAQRPSRRYGIWRMEDAVRYGYQLQPDDAVRKKLMNANAPDPVGGWQEAYLACGQEKAAKDLRITGAEGPSPALVGFTRYGDVMQSSAGQHEWAQWASCLRAAKVDPPPAPEWIAGGWMRADQETQIRIAVADVRCKQRLNTVQHLADLEATAQQGVIDRHEAELAQDHAKLRGRLDVAQVVINAHGG